MLECVVNISEGRDPERIARICGAAGPALLDVHSDAHHHRSVLTLAGEDGARAVAAAAVAEIDLRTHVGVHPRFGVVDVVPFVALDGSTEADAVAARDRFATWFATAHEVPCFLYGAERTLPEVRRRAFLDLAPDTGPPVPHPTAGASAVGQRGVLVAFNVWVAAPDLAPVRAVAAAVRGPAVRALGLRVGGRYQVSMNLIDPVALGPADAFDRVVEATLDSDPDLLVTGAELVGLLPDAVLRGVPRARWSSLGLSDDRTIEARLEATGHRRRPGP